MKTLNELFEIAFAALHNLEDRTGYESERLGNIIAELGAFKKDVLKSFNVTICYATKKGNEVTKNFYIQATGHTAAQYIAEERVRGYKNFARIFAGSTVAATAK